MIAFAAAFMRFNARKSLGFRNPYFFATLVVGVFQIWDRCQRIRRERPTGEIHARQCGRQNRDLAG